MLIRARYLYQLTDSKLVIKYADAGLFDTGFYEVYHNFFSSKYSKIIIWKISKNEKLTMTRDDLIKFKVNDLRCHKKAVAESIGLQLFYWR